MLDLNCRHTGENGRKCRYKKWREKTLITTYQIRNVLRIYGNQLKRRNSIVEDSLDPPKQHKDVVDISMDARQKHMVERMSKRLISQISPKNNEQNNDVSGPEGNVPGNPDA